MLTRFVFFCFAGFMAFDLYKHADKYHMSWFRDPMFLSATFLILLFLILLRNKKFTY